MSRDDDDGTYPYRGPVVPVAGTINRPLWNPQFKRDKTVRWGDSVALTANNNQSTVVTEFARIELPAPRVCSLAINARVIIPATGTSFVTLTALEITTGVGASMYTRRLAFSNLPNIGADLNYVLSQFPLNNIHIRATMTIATATTTRIILTAQLSPIESVPQ